MSTNSGAALPDDVQEAFLSVFRSIANFAGEAAADLVPRRITGWKACDTFRLHIDSKRSEDDCLRRTGFLIYFYVRDPMLGPIAL